MKRPSRLALTLLLLLPLALAGCGDTTGGSGTDTDSAPQGGFPVTIDTPRGEVTIERRPERIVSLSPSTTEILFAVGAGDQVVAVDEFSTYPEQAPTTDLSGFEPNVEAVLSYEPDLVVINLDVNGLADSLEQAGVTVVLDPAPTRHDEGYDGMAALGLATGHPDEAADLVATMRARMQAAFDSVDLPGPVRVYHELDSQYFSASSASFIGSVYEEFGVVNIADAADTSRTGYPQLTEEAIIEADPQVIVITDQSGYTAEQVAARPGWQQISAVTAGNIVAVDADIASRWGPRMPDLVTELAEALEAARVPAGN